MPTQVPKSRITGAVNTARTPAAYVLLVDRFQSCHAAAAAAAAAAAVTERDLLVPCAYICSTTTAGLVRGVERWLRPLRSDVGAIHLLYQKRWHSPGPRCQRPVDLRRAHLGTLRLHTGHGVCRMGNRPGHVPTHFIQFSGDQAAPKLAVIHLMGVSWVGNTT